MSDACSATPLPRKLGIKPGQRVLVLHPPPGFALDLPPGTQLGRARATNDVILSFHTSRADLERQLPKLRELMEPAAGLWIAWPKRAAGSDSDITEDVVRAAALDNALVDNKVCAIDAFWSGLRLVIRLRDRPGA